MSMSHPHSSCRLFILLLFGALYGAHCAGGEEVFNEEMLIRPLPDGNVAVHLEFSTEWFYGVDEAALSHYNLFPKQIGQLVRNFEVDELHLTFTSGRWRSMWGEPISLGPLGAELRASTQSPGRWRGLKSALSGLFCASLDFMDDTTTSHPQFMFGPAWGSRNTTQTEMYYATLPREVVCTENLTPWIKLLPCRAYAGLATLINPLTTFRGDFNSMAVHVKHSCHDEGVAGGSCARPGLKIVQTLTVVVSPSSSSSLPHPPTPHSTPPLHDWSLSSLLHLHATPTAPRSQLTPCPLSSNSRLYLELEEWTHHTLAPSSASSSASPPSFTSSSSSSLCLLPPPVTLFHDPLQVHPLMRSAWSRCVLDPTGGGGGRRGGVRSH